MKTTWPAFRCGCLIVAGVLLGGSTASVRGQDAAGANTAAAVISSVAITQDTQRAAIRVEGAGRLDVHAARMQNPERLVLDFAGARMGVQKTSIPGVSAPVRSGDLSAAAECSHGEPGCAGRDFHSDAEGTKRTFVCSGHAPRVRPKP